MVWAFASPGPLPLALDPLDPWQLFSFGAQRKERIAAEAKPAANERTERSGGPVLFKEKCSVLRGYRGIYPPVGRRFLKLLLSSYLLYKTG